MAESFYLYVRRLWLSALPAQLVRSVLIAALFELAVYVISGRVRKALAPALARDHAADPAHRLERRRIVLGVPLMLVRAVLNVTALLLILRVFRFNSSLDLYPVALGLLVIGVVACRSVLRDAVAGYFIHYDYLFGPGDEITVGEASGVVTELTMRHTRLRDRSGREVTIRNSLVRDKVTCDRKAEPHQEPERSRR